MHPALACFTAVRSPRVRVVAVVGTDAEALDELHRYLWCCGALTRSSTRLAHAARLPPRGGVLVLFVDDFSMADVVVTLREAHALDIFAAILVTAHASTLHKLEGDVEIGAMLLILDAPVQVWTLLDTVRACFDRRNAPAA